MERGITMKLQGTEKQIAWAEDIIKAYKERFEELMESLEKGISSKDIDDHDIAKRDILCGKLGLYRVDEETGHKEKISEFSSLKTNHRKEMIAEATETKGGKLEKEEKRAITRANREWVKEELKREAQAKAEEILAHDEASYWIDNFKELTYK